MTSSELDSEYLRELLLVAQDIRNQLVEMNSKLDTGLSLANSPLGKTVRKAQTFLEDFRR